MDGSLPEGLDLSQIPIAPPPPGVVPDLAHPQTLQEVTIEMTAVFLTVAVAFCAMDLWYHRKKFRRTEWLVILALPFVITYTAIMVAYSPFAKHVWETPISEAFDGPGHSLQFSMVMLSVPSGLLTKTAILCLYLEVFKTDHRFKTAAYVALVFALVVYTPWLIVGPIFCGANGSAWDVSKLLKCEKLVIWSLLQSLLNLVLDLFLFIMPIPVLVKLQLPIQRKIAIIAVFATALLGIGATGLSVAYRFMLLREKDATWYTHMCELAGFVEYSIALIVCCAPGCAGCFRHLKSKAMNIVSGTRTGHSRTTEFKSRSQTDRSSCRGSFEGSENPLRSTHSGTLRNEKQYTPNELELGLQLPSHDSVFEIDRF